MDWQKLISDLIAAGHTQAQIAARVGLTQPTVSAIYNGAVRRPSWDVGNAILAMHADVIRSPEEGVDAR